MQLLNSEKGKKKKNEEGEEKSEEGICISLWQGNNY